MNNNLSKKILLGILPYWDPLIPPSGIATLKGYLNSKGFKNVKTVDLIVKNEFQDLYQKYFAKIEEIVSFEKRGNLYNQGHNVLQDHMMAYLNKYDDKDYFELVELMINQEFSVQVQKEELNYLDRLIQEIYAQLEKYIRKQLVEFEPEFVGFSVYKGTLPASLFCFQLVKKINPNITTILGGSVFSTTLDVESPNYDIIVNETKDYIDKIVIGEGEIIIEKILMREIPDDKRILSISKLNLKNLDFKDAKLPDYSEFDMSLYPYIAATGSSSCPFKCSFCNSAKYWGKYRKKEISQTVDEMFKLYENHGKQLFYMSDSYINPIVTDLANEFIRREATLYYDCFHRVDDKSTKIENTMHWRKGGLYRVRLGVESGSQKILDHINKKITVDQSRAVLSAFAFAGIKTTTYWVIGHPGETEEDFNETLNLLKEMGNYIYQAEPAPLEYVYSGQAHSKDWGNKRILKYPKHLSRKLLLSYNWELNDPKREVMVDRIQRFDNLRHELGIPNPYSLQEHFKADERWKSLHKNAVPAIIEFYEKKYINESQDIIVPSMAKAHEDNSGDFNF